MARTMQTVNPSDTTRAAGRAGEPLLVLEPLPDPRPLPDPLPPPTEPILPDPLPVPPSPEPSRPAVHG